MSCRAALPACGLSLNIRLDDGTHAHYHNRRSGPGLQKNRLSTNISATNNTIALCAFRHCSILGLCLVSSQPEPSALRLASANALLVSSLDYKLLFCDERFLSLPLITLAPSPGATQSTRFDINKTNKHLHSLPHHRASAGPDPYHTLGIRARHSRVHSDF